MVALIDPSFKSPGFGVDNACKHTGSHFRTQLDNFTDPVTPY